jgi:hypothetical protein
MTSREARLVELLCGLDGDNSAACQFVLETLVASSLSGSFPLDFLSVLLLLHARQPDEQLLQQLNALVQRHTRLKRACVLAGWTERLLRELARDQQPLLMMLCSTLASFSVGVGDVRVLLRFAQSHQQQRPACWPLVVNMLESAASRSPGPCEYYDCSGSSSGLLLPQLPKLPGNGLTFTCWLRVEAFGREPVLLALCDETDQGLVIKFSSNFMVLQSQSAGKKAVCFSVTFPFKTGQWYNVAVTHEYHFVGSDQISVFVDGQMRGQFALPYPKNAGPLTCATVGCLKTDRRSNHTLVGQVSAFFLLDGPCNSLFARLLFEAGPNAALVLPRDKQGALLLGKQSMPVVLAYSPRAADGALCLETQHGARGLHALKMVFLALLLFCLFVCC